MPWSTEGGNVEFCHRTGDTTTIPSSTTCPTHSNPTWSIDDGVTVTVTTIDGSRGNECGDAISLACIKPTRISDEAIPDQTIYVKDPAYVQKGHERLRVEWTLDSREHNTENDELDEDGRRVVKLYLPGVIMHELGHAAGLDELRDNPEHSDSVMHYGTETYERLVTEVSAKDAEYLRYNQQQGENQSGRIRRKVTR